MQEDNHIATHSNSTEQFVIASPPLADGNLAGVAMAVAGGHKHLGEIATNV